MKTLEEFLLLSPEARRKTRVRRKPRGPYLKRPQRTQDELIAFIKSNNITSVRQLKRLRKPDEPNYYDFAKAFGASSWSTVTDKAFGKPMPFSLPQRPTANYIITSIADFDLWTRDAYEKKRAAHPDILYSPYWIRTLFGTWDKAKWGAEQISCRACLNRWLALTRRLGRAPTLGEIDQAGISLEPLRRVHKTNREIAEFLDDLANTALTPKSPSQ